jgi:hypothetical protein
MVDIAVRDGFAYTSKCPGPGPRVCTSWKSPENWELGNATVQLDGAWAVFSFGS